MDDFGFLGGDERLQDLLRKCADVADWEAVKLADLEQIVQRNVQQFKGQEQVFPEGEEVLQLDDPGGDVRLLALIK